MTTENEIRASLLLSRMPGLTQPQARALLQYYGTAEAAFAAHITTVRHTASVHASHPAKSIAVFV